MKYIFDMYSERQNVEQNPSAVWQGSWAELIKQVIIQMTEANYQGAWETMLLMQVLIPPECEKETRKDYRRAEKVMLKPVEAHNRVEGFKRKEKQIKSEAPAVIRGLIGAVRTSLFVHGWINREGGAKPLKLEKPHIKSDA